jgi:hypothetical protein
MVYMLYQRELSLREVVGVINKMRGTSKRRVLYLSTAVAVICLSGGFVLAAGLTSTTVTQSADLYSVSSSAIAAFPTTPTVTVTAVPASVAACSASTQTLANSVTVNIYLAASSGITCTTNDFAEEFSFSSAATAAAGVYTFTDYTTYGTAPTSGSTAGSVTVAAVMSISGQVNVFVDYGTAAPPINGIAELSLVVQ